MKIRTAITVMSPIMSKDKKVPKFSEKSIKKQN